MPDASISNPLVSFVRLKYQSLLPPDCAGMVQLCYGMSAFAGTLAKTTTIIGRNQHAETNANPNVLTQVCSQIMQL